MKSLMPCFNWLCLCDWSDIYVIFLFNLFLGILFISLREFWASNCWILRWLSYTFSPPSSTLHTLISYHHRWSLWTKLSLFNTQGWLFNLRLLLLKSQRRLKLPGRSILKIDWYWLFVWLFSTINCPRSFFFGIKQRLSCTMRYSKSLLHGSPFIN